MLKAKLAEPAVCPECSAVWRRGRWIWDRRPEGAQEHLCPACKRIAGQEPAGRIRVEGDLGARKREIVQLIRHQELAEMAEHPLERLIDLDEEPWGLSITTTGLHLARRIAEALRRAWHGRMEIRYAKDENLVRVRLQPEPVARA